MSDSVVIIPTYNEKENIERILRSIFSLEKPFHVLVVDDNSPDDTPGIVKRMQSEFPDRLFLEVRTGKGGLGTAYIHGFKWALKRSYEYIFEMDADFSHDPGDLLALYNACREEGADLSIGSRYVRGGKIRNWPWERVLMSYLASLYVRAVLFLGIRDTTAGFKCYRREVLETIDLDRVSFLGYAFQIEMKYAAKKAGFELKEVPITFVDRKWGESKMDIGIFKEAFFGVLKMRLNK